MDLFSHFKTSDNETPQNDIASPHLPLAEKVRPQTINEMYGQGLLLDEQAPLLKNLRQWNFLPNLILWGPPGSGKTTLAGLLTRELNAHLINCNAIDTGAKELRTIGSEARDRRLQQQRKTVLFIDEIHRLNRAQQDVLLPYLEKGDLILIGATTENPSYELNSALLSRAQVLRLVPLNQHDLRALLERALEIEGLALKTLLSDSAVDVLTEVVAGDARRLLNMVETLLNYYKSNTALGAEFPLQPSQIQPLLSSAISFDKKGAEHYDCISAFIKSVRGSDPDAAVYYLARLLEGGEDPVFIARRLVILSSEDIGNADPQALTLATAALHAVELVGMPEARISLAQATCYLASAPKSNKSYVAIENALEFVRKTGALEVPLALRSSNTTLSKAMGYGQDYKYSHEGENGYIAQEFLPEKARGQKFYQPSASGFEKRIVEYLNWLRRDPS